MNKLVKSLNRLKIQKNNFLQCLPHSPRNWWNYAISVHRDRIREKNEHRTWSFLAGRVHDILLYFKAYTVYLIGEQLSTRMTVSNVMFIRFDKPKEV